MLAKGNLKHKLCLACTIRASDNQVKQGFVRRLN